MVQAILKNRKSQTRRIVTDKDFSRLGLERDGDCIYTTDGPQWDGTFEGGKIPWSRYGLPGDRLWVREKWRLPGAHFDTKLSSYGDNASLFFADKVCYAADEDEDDYEGTYRPSIFLPRWASRITLEITDIRIERLHEISHEDAIAEGFQGKGWKVSQDGKSIVYPCHEFRDLWKKINGQSSWDSNPWVWVISFKRVEA